MGLGCRHGLGLQQSISSGQRSGWESRRRLVHRGQGYAQLLSHSHKPSATIRSSPSVFTATEMDLISGTRSSCKRLISAPHQAGFRRNLWQGHLSFQCHSFPQHGHLRFRLQNGQKFRVFHGAVSYTRFNYV